MSGSRHVESFLEMLAAERGAARNTLAAYQADLDDFAGFAAARGIAVQAADAEALRRDEALVIPADLDFAAVGGLSNEVREKLIAVRPRTLGQAGRIEGVTPGALTALLAHVRRTRETAAA